MRRNVPPALAALLHFRPRSWPIVAAHLAAGYVAAAGWPALADPWPWITPLVAAAALWAVALNGGTLALNGAVDRDAGDVGYLDAPPPPPRGLAALGIGAMALGGAVLLALRGAGLFGPSLAPLYAACVLLSLLYSLPPIRLKARPGLDLAVNILGYGAGTFLAGWAATLLPLQGSHLWSAAGFGLLFAALYPLTQIYQMEDDARAGVRTLALVMGRRGSLLLAVAAVLSAFTCLAVAARQTAAIPYATAVILLPGLGWLAILVPRLRHGGADCGKRDMYAGLAAWAITDLAAVLALAPHAAG